MLDHKIFFSVRQIIFLLFLLNLFTGFISVHWVQNHLSDQIQVTPYSSLFLPAQKTSASSESCGQKNIVLYRKTIKSYRM